MAMPFAPASFHSATMGYGLRNVASIPDALAELHRVLKPGEGVGGLKGMQGCKQAVGRPPLQGVPWLAGRGGRGRAGGEGSRAGCLHLKAGSSFFCLKPAQAPGLGNANSAPTLPPSRRSLGVGVGRVLAPSQPRW